MPSKSDLTKLALNYAHHRDSQIYRHGKQNVASDTEQLLAFYKSVSCDRTTIKNYNDFCDLADHLRKEYEYDIKVPPCNNGEFDNLVADVARRDQLSSTVTSQATQTQQDQQHQQEQQQQQDQQHQQEQQDEQNDQQETSTPQFK